MQKRSNTVSVTSFYLCVPGMAWIQLDIDQPQVFTAKCSEPQAVDSDVFLSSVRTET